MGRTQEDKRGEQNLTDGLTGGLPFARGSEHVGTEGKKTLRRTEPHRKRGRRRKRALEAPDGSKKKQRAPNRQTRQRGAGSKNKDRIRKKRTHNRGKERKGDGPWVQWQKRTSSNAGKKKGIKWVQMRQAGEGKGKAHHKPTGEKSKRSDGSHRQRKKKAERNSWKQKAQK